MDTIFALSSGALPSGIAIIRISGPATSAILFAMSGRLPRPRQAEFRTIRRPSDGEVLDRGLVLWFPAPGSYTGEDLCELHVHGSRAVIAAIFEAISGLGGRMSEPGEFSRRAFHNGKIDLTRAEGLADLLAAETEMQRRQAMAQSDGLLARQASAWLDQLLTLRAEVEARLDFADEGDVPGEIPEDFWRRIAEMRAEMGRAVDPARGGERLRDGFKVAILGLPNAGKSSLLNALARRDAAIVTAEPGTTRDIIEVSLDLGGYPVRLFDTAGIREAESEAEREGVRRSARVASDADLLLWLQDPLQSSGAPADILGDKPTLLLSTKADLGRGADSGSLAISAKTGAGIGQLLETIQQAASDAIGSGNAVITRARHRQAIFGAIRSLELIGGYADEICADLLRSASESIARLTGRIGAEEVLDRLFGEFCIGK